MFKNNKAEVSVLAKHALEKSHEFDFKEVKFLAYGTDYSNGAY